MATPEAESAQPATGVHALAFVNTHRFGKGGLEDLVATPQQLLAWLVERGIVPPPGLRSSPPEARRLLDEAHRLRAGLRALLEAYGSGRTPDAGAVLGVQRLLSACAWSWRLEPAPRRPALRELGMGRSPLQALGAIALDGARLLSSVDPSRLRTCASPTCRAWFVDTSRGGRRRWCSMARCGNRVKASTHRARKRTR